MMADVPDVEVVLANNDRVTVRVGDTFLKIDGDPDRQRAEVQAIRSVPVPTPTVLWHEPPVLALGALRGHTLGRLGQRSTASAAAWAAVGAALATLHDAPLPAREGPTIEDLRSRLDDECDWLASNGVLPEDVLERHGRRAEQVLRPFEPTFVHGDLHLEHVFVDGDAVTGIIDWSEARQGDPLWDLASLTLGDDERLEDLIAGYGSDVDRDMVRAWWSWRCLVVVRWLTENGYGSPDTLPEVALLRSLP